MAHALIKDPTTLEAVLKMTDVPVNEALPKDEDLPEPTAPGEDTAQDQD